MNSRHWPTVIAGGFLFAAGVVVLFVSFVAVGAMLLSAYPWSWGEVGSVVFSTLLMPALCVLHANRNRW